MNPRDNAPAEGSQAQTLFRDALLHVIADASATLDAEGRISAVNAAMEELFGQHQSVLVGEPLSRVFRAGETAIEEAFGNACVWESEIVAIDAAGREQPTQLRLYPVFDGAGHLAGWVATARRAADPVQTGEIASSVDPLTNLPDRNFVKARLTHALKGAVDDDWAVTVLCIDLDNFDNVNRDYGRAVGDQVLIETGRRIGQSMRGSNIIGRLVDDMFIVVVPDIRTPEQVTAVASRLIAAIGKPYFVKGARDPLILTASVGIAISPENSTDPDQLIGYAQAAVDLAKSAGQGTYQFYTNTTGIEMRERRSRVSQLRRAIEEEQLFLRYQPKVSLITGEIVAAEALVRWQDPASGLIMPAEFIPLAEDAGLIDPLGHMVLTEACRTLRSWQDAGLPFLRLAVNVSAREVARRSFFEDLVDILERAEIEPDRLELEITESAVMEGAEDVIRSLREIRKLGVHLTADDFGTGYASLSYLRNFPLDGIKIDTTFVADIDKSAEGGGLAAGVISVGHSLGMNVVAEGVETEHQLSFLRWRECDEVQGYLISEPLAPDAFMDMVRNGAVL